MAKNSVWTVVVESGPIGGSFPIDMLRYDSLMPMTEQDSVRISATFAPLRERREMQIGQITLRTAPGGLPPTEGRWNSFGWKVVSKKEARY